MGWAADTERKRVYLAIRLGGALFVDTKPVPDIQVSRIAGQQLIAGAVGVNLGRHWGVEVAADGYETDLELNGVGRIGEYAVWTVIPQLRWRYPLLDNRLSPYAVGGVGFGFTEFNDPTPRSINVRVEANDTTIVGALGGGLDYFVVGNIAVGVETKYLIMRGANFQINSRGNKADLDTVLMSGGLRILFP
jgi:opacity protein-like surface antigen